MDALAAADGAQQQQQQQQLCGLQMVRETAELALNALYGAQGAARASSARRQARLQADLERAGESLERCYQVVTQIQAQMFADDPVADRRIADLYHWTLSSSSSSSAAAAELEQQRFESVAIQRRLASGRNYDALGYLLPHIKQGFDAVRAVVVVVDQVWSGTRRNRLLVECNKIAVLVDLIPAALAAPVHSVVQGRPIRFVADALEPCADPDGLARNLATFASRLEKVKCMANDAAQHSNGILRHLKLAASGLYYSANPDQARHESTFVGVDPDIRMIKLMWNLTEHAVGRALYKITLPAVAQHASFHISPSDLDDDDVQQQQPPVKVRYLSSRRSSRVAHNIERMRNRGGCQADDDDDDDDAVPGPLILHFHGGGFVAQSSYSHQTYTRQWANGTDVAVLSVDYRLAPEAQYPAAVHDAWLVYRWCLKHGRRQLGIDPQRIVVSGDSAGGNLAAALTIRALGGGVSPPIGMLLAYPCLCLSADVFYPSSLSCLDEVMIPYGFLLACIKAYVPDDADPLLDPLLSPALVADDVLRRFPPLKIMVGARDPLLDQSVEFAQRLHLLGKDVRLIVYTGFGHGFLSFDNPVVGVPESHACVLKSIEWLRELTWR